MITCTIGGPGMTGAGSATNSNGAMSTDGIDSGALQHWKVAIVGAGPVGLAVLSTLLDAGKNSILWVDPYFMVGRLSKYTEVPSNTKVKLFQQFVKTSPSLNQYTKEALAQFEGQDPERGCSLVISSPFVQSKWSHETK